MAKILKQVRMVFDLNKCLGCQTCTMACKTAWSDRNPGQQYMYWNNVESQPGRGYPRNWETLGGGFRNCSTFLLKSPLPTLNDYGAPWEYNYDQVLKTSGGIPSAAVIVPSPEPAGPDAYSNNWDEDVGEGVFPNSYYFYLPRNCNHCTNPACVAACPRQAIYKRAEDGIVLVDQTRCRGYRHCIKACPYKKVYFNSDEKVTQKCIFCYPRTENRQGNFCVTQCVGRLRWVGYSDNPASNVNRLVEEFRVALRLHPEFGTQPNTFYIPPFSPPGAGQLPDTQRIPFDYLANMFGDDCRQTQAQRVVRIQEIFSIIRTEQAKVASGLPSALVDILTSRSETDRVQL
jgi:DMSO reductase family type II enzyme iron-sulfur subunit